MILEGYADGGMIGPVNPCPFGGTWGFVTVGRRGVYHKESGVILAGGPDWPNGPVTNNASEYYAMLRLLVSLPDGWSGRVYTDSRVTIQRFFHDVPANVPKHWAEMLGHTIRRLGKIEPILLAGHPSKRDLALGMKKGKPVSEYNALCDRLCKIESDKWMAAMKMKSLEELVNAKRNR